MTAPTATKPIAITSDPESAGSFCLLSQLADGQYVVHQLMTIPGRYQCMSMYITCTGFHELSADGAGYRAELANGTVLVITDDYSAIEYGEELAAAWRANRCQPGEEIEPPVSPLSRLMITDFDISYSGSDGMGVTLVPKAATQYPALAVTATAHDPSSGKYWLIIESPTGFYELRHLVICFDPTYADRPHTYLLTGFEPLTDLPDSDGYRAIIGDLVLVIGRQSSELQYPDDKRMPLTTVDKTAIRVEYRQPDGKFVVMLNQP